MTDTERIGINLLVAWIKDPLRKPPALAFTSGWLREAADAIEVSGVLEENVRLMGALEHIAYEQMLDDEKLVAELQRTALEAIAPKEPTT